MIIKKTIYYDNAIIKVYDIPIFICLNYHPDPTVIRSGFHHFFPIKNLGSGISIPYFLDLGIDKNFLQINFMSQKIAIFRRISSSFQNSYLLTDFGYTKGYKKTSSSKLEKNLIFFLSPQKISVVMIMKVL